MKENFFGTTSSEFAKSRYVPVQDNSKLGKFNLSLGTNTSSIMQQDAKLVGFTSAKHKFVGKMFQDYDKVLEVGCMDGYGSMIVSQFVKSLTSIDFYAPHIAQAEQYVAPYFNNIKFKGYDFLDGPINQAFDGCFCLDVLEHIDPTQEDIFLKNVVASLGDSGAFIVGMPSLESQVYASATNKFAHINCKTSEDFQTLLERHFKNVFSFGMNDEILHTGYPRMCQYLIKLCTGPIRNL
ncbi:class I SAM-dependent methyltransferase [Thalassospira alkalitolerans]|uniref:class I SAM-dependent methyltransferase n=1 Tax=Thalassospira alkalitolerans TaxID=1293890 RepID=UPI003AA9B7EC